MEQHNVALSDLEKVQKSAFEFGVDQVVAHRSSKLDRWMKNMISVVTTICDCKCYFSKKADHLTERGKVAYVYEVVFYGEKTDIAAAASLYVELLIVFPTMAKHKLGKWSQRHYHYMDGFGIGMLDTLYQQREEIARQRAESTRTLIVSKHDAITKWAEKNLKLGVAKGRKTIKKSEENGGAFTAGRQDGREYGTKAQEKLTS